MIAVTRLNGTRYYVNALLIETIEETPDTQISLTTGKKIVVLEKTADLIVSIQDYLRSIGVFAATLKSGQTEGTST